LKQQKWKERMSKQATTIDDAEVARFSAI